MFDYIYKFRETFQSLLFEYGSPRQLALAVALGVFIGVSPFIGLHTILAILFSFLLRLNKPAVLLGTLIFNPLSAPFLIFISLEIGSWLIYDNLLLPSVQEIKLLLKNPSWMDVFKEFILPYFWGSLLVGAVLSFISFWITLWISRSAQTPNHQEEG